MTILAQAPSVPSVGMVKLDEIAKECNEQENAKNEKTIKAKKKRRTCQKLGQDKHACCEEKIQEHRDANPPDGDPKIRGEQCFKRPKYDAATKRSTTPASATPLGTDRGSVIRNAIAGAGPGASRKQISSAIGKALGGKVFPDASVVGPGGEQTFVDFKFACPPSNRSKKKSAVKNYRPPEQSSRQLAAHNALGKATGGGMSVTIRY